MNRDLRTLWHTLLSNSRRAKNPLEFDFKNNVRALLGGERSNTYTHHMHRYPGKVFPYIPAFLLSIPELCPAGGTVLDPFCGSGTVLLESVTHPLCKRNAYGVEVNPLGRLIAKVKTTPLDERELSKRARCLLRAVNQISDSDIDVADSKSINFWFSDRAIHGLSKLRHTIEGLDDSDYTDFFWICFSSIIRKVSRADPFIPPPVVLKIHKYRHSPRKYRFLRRFLEQAQNPDVVGRFREAIKENSERIASLNGVKEMTKGKITARVLWDDARAIRIGTLRAKGEIGKQKARALRRNSVDLIVTSPPYITAQKYIRTHKLELLWLGLLSEQQVARMEREIIGSEKVSAREVDFGLSTGVKSIDSLIGWALSVSPQRAATLLKYFLDMRRAVAEMHRVLKDGSCAIIVVGNNRVLGRKVDTYRLLRELAGSLGFRLEVVLTDQIRGRGMITRRHNSGGLIKEEFVVVLRKEAA